MDRQVKVFLLKIAGRCNIACDYCYEYRLADTSWRVNPKIMLPSVLEAAVRRIREHALIHALRRVSIIFHGGEPLLAGREFIAEAVGQIRNALDGVAEAHFGLQTNGVLLDEKWLGFFLNLNIKVGVSVDGDQTANDRHRIDFQGRSTHAEVLSALKLMQQPRFESVRGGLLGVIQPDTDPVETFEWFRSWKPPQIDFLFPHHNHARRPQLPYDTLHGYGFGMWLAKVFEHWWENDLADVKVRIFEDLMHLMLGGTWTVESFGLAPVELVVIQTGGGYEAVDSLKSTFDGAVSTGKNVFGSSVDEILDAELIASRMDRVAALSQACLRCRLVRVCGGGYIPHRWHDQTGFRNPSVYCADLQFLIERIELALQKEGGEEIRHRLRENLQPLEEAPETSVSKYPMSQSASGRIYIVPTGESTATTGSAALLRACDVRTKEDGAPLRTIVLH